MSQAYRFVALTGALLLFATVAVAAPPMKAGKWAITTTTSISGMPMAMAMPPRTVSRCITPDDLKKGVSMAIMRPEAKDRDNPCKMSDIAHQGNKYTWQVQCSGEAAGTGRGEVEYFGDHYSGQFEMSTAQGMKMTNHIQGRYVGACD